MCNDLEWMVQINWFCLLFSIPLENCSLIWRCHHYWWRATSFDLYSALMAIEQWGFFSVSHLLWHGTSFHNCHLLELMTLAPACSRAVTPCFYDSGLSKLGFELMMILPIFQLVTLAQSWPHLLIWL